MLTLLRCLFLSMLAASAVAQAGSESAFNRLFGAGSATGSFQARFAKDGAGLVWLQAADHYVTLAARRKATHDANDYLLLVANGSDHGLRLFHTLPSPAGPA